MESDYLFESISSNLAKQLVIDESYTFRLKDQIALPVNGGIRICKWANVFDMGIIFELSASLKFEFVQSGLRCRL